MLTISEFAKKCGTSVKTIRYYDNIGLLKADYIIPETNYRCYEASSVEKYQQILKLKLAGFSLKEISGYVLCITEGTGGEEQLLNGQMRKLREQQRHCQELLELLHGTAD